MRPGSEDMAGGWLVGIDIGGTFTDVVAVASDDGPDAGTVRTAKVDTRTDDRVLGLVSALEAVGLGWDDVSDLVHGTTMVTNAIVENKLADAALVATRGFSDTLAIGRQNRRHLYRLDLEPKPAPQIPAERRFEVDGRLDHTGAEIEPAGEDSITRAVERVVASGVESVAVSLLHSYADGGHEQRIAEALKGRVPYVSMSHRVNPEAREYERTVTTALSAGLMPLVGQYLDRLEGICPETTHLHLFHSAGGMASTGALREAPLALAMSGPAAGVVAASAIARDLGLDLAISFDMGGTTTDICLIRDGEAQVSSDRELGGRPIRQPMVAVDSIGAGGGSIARLDHGTLRVGPESAGSFPGPACYGRGGTLPTVSDANLLLGYLEPGKPLGGGLQLRPDLARDAILPLAEALGWSVERAALGVVRVANSAMMQALRRSTVEHGIDGREAVLIAFGGAGPMHAVAVAREFGMSRVIVPAHSSVFSALGCVSAEMSYSQQRTVRMPVGAWDAAALDGIREDLRAQVTAPLRASGFGDGDIAVQEVAALRYSGQSYAIEVPNPDFGDLDTLGQRFFALHHKLYGYATDEPWQLEAIRMRASVPGKRKRIGAPPPAQAEPVAVKTLPCVFDDAGPVPTPRYRRGDVGTESMVNGPAIIEDDHATIVIDPGASAFADEKGHLHILTGPRQ